jgi:hypothetical protein
MNTGREKESEIDTCRSARWKARSDEPAWKLRVRRIRLGLLQQRRRQREKQKKEEDEDSVS